MFLKTCLVVAMTLAYGSFGQVPQTTTNELTPRELYYKEEQVPNEKLPPVPAAAPKPSVKPEPKPHPRAPVIPVVDHLGLRYSLLLKDKNTNQMRPVDPDGVFHTGDCFALELQPNRAGYVYVLQRLPDGNWDPLFPNFQIQGESEIVQGRTKQRVPQAYCFALDEQKGEEHLYLILSRNPEQASDLRDAFLRKRRPNGETPAGNESIVDASYTHSEAAEAVAELASRGFKIMKLSEQDDGDPKYSVFVVPANSEKKDTVFADIRIKHE